MADLNYVPQIDYTSRDYLSIRDDLINLIPTFAPDWTNRDESDFGIAILQMFAYMGALMSYYVDRSANEAFISTASKRSSILRQAALLDYQPTLRNAARVTLTFSNSTASPITVPAGTQIATSTTATGEEVPIYFELDNAVVVPAQVGATPGANSVTATEGKTVSNEFVRLSTGIANQTYPLEQSPVIEDSIEIEIDGVVYTKVQYLIDVTGATPAFSTFTDADDITYVQFGDNIGGRIPPINKSITATYRIGGGLVGNVPGDTIQEIDPDNLWGAPAGLTVTNVDAAAYGADAESTDSIKINAPASIKALNRAVSPEDYASLALQVSGIQKASATAENYSSVVIYMRGFNDRGVQIDGVTPTTDFTNAATRVSNYLVGKAPANTTLSIAPPDYVGVDIICDVTVLPQYRQYTVQQAVLDALGDILFIDSVLFGDRISLQYVLKTIGSINGVDFTEMKVLRRSNSNQLFNLKNKALTSDVATLTTNTTHDLTVGQTVTINGVDATFNGTYVVTAVPSTTTFSYVKVATNVSSTAITASYTVTNKALTSNLATITTSVAHTLEVGDVVTVESVDATFNGKYRVYSVPTTTTFTYVKVDSNVTSASATGNVWATPYVQVLKVEDIVCDVDELPEAGVITVNASGGITS